jgi:hypothetical protein
VSYVQRLSRSEVVRRRVLRREAGAVARAEQAILGIEARVRLPGAELRRPGPGRRQAAREGQSPQA